MARGTKSLSEQSREVNVLFAPSWYYPEIHRGVARFARDHNWHVTADFDDPVPKHWRGNGVLTHLGARQNVWKTLRKFNVPIVDLTESRPNISLPRVTVDNAAIGRLAARHFADRGFRHFAFVHRWDLGVSRRRCKAYVNELASLGLTCDILCWQNEVARGKDTRQRRHGWLKKCIGKLPKPVAIFTTRDTEAVEVMEACLDAGLSIPEDAAILGVDNSEVVCDCLRVPLSSIDSNLEEIGYQGAALLHDLMNGRTPPESPIYIPPVGVVQRRSTDSIAVGHVGVARALRFIHDHANEAIGMIDVVKHVGISRSGLEKAFREYFVRPPMEELRRVRLDRARQLLVESDDTVVAIAAATGFQSSHNLCRTFKQHVGLTPRQYRLRTRAADDSSSNFG